MEFTWVKLKATRGLDKQASLLPQDPAHSEMYDQFTWRYLNAVMCFPLTDMWKPSHPATKVATKGYPSANGNQTASSSFSTPFSCFHDPGPLLLVMFRPIWGLQTSTPSTVNPSTPVWGESLINDFLNREKSNLPMVISSFNYVNHWEDVSLPGELG